MNKKDTKGLHEKLIVSDLKTGLKLGNKHLNKKNIIQII